MSKGDRTELALERLSALKTVPNDSDVIGEIRRFVADRSNLVVARAAKIAKERGLVQLIPELVTTFQRLMADPPRLDKRCAALTEIAAALYELDYPEPDLYLQGLHHIQMEASFGPPIDTAAELRGICAQGLVRTRHPHALEEVVSLLADAQAPARIGAVRALAINGGDAGALVLRLKALTGDRDPEVIAECFAGLLTNSRDKAVEFVASFCERGDGEFGDVAILALGASRLAKAIEFLKEKWQRTIRSPDRRTILLALATSRDEVALNFVLKQLNEGSPQIAAEIIAALAVHKKSETIRRAVGDAVDRRRDRILLEAFRREFAE
jgi:hypothetical protein